MSRGDCVSWVQFVEVRDWDGETFRRLRREDAHERAVLRGVTWVGCHFVGCVFGALDMRDCVFEDCTFTSCDLSGARFEQTSLRDVTFQSCKLLGVWGSNLRFSFGLVLRDCVLNMASFQGADLSNSRWETCTVREVHFEEASLRGAVFVETDLTGSVFSRADLSCGDFVDTRGLDLDPDTVTLSETRLSVATWIACASYCGVKVGH